MMMEQQKILKNEEIQNRWKCYMKATSIVVSKCERGFESLYEILSNIWDRIVELLEVVKEAIMSFFNSFSFEEYIKNLENFIIPKRPRYRPHKSYGTYKINTKGYTLPIMRCARSRC